MSDRYSFDPKNFRRESFSERVKVTIGGIGSIFYLSSALPLVIYQTLSENYAEKCYSMRENGPRQNRTAAPST